jgi:HEAT repeat protein
VHLSAIESLGALRADQTVELLKEALYSGDWWSPFRTAHMRRTVAAALRQIASQNALRVLEEASERGPRAVRAAVRATR